MTNQENKAKSMPEKIFKAGPCSASVFANEITTMNGKATVKSVSLQRAYLGKEGNFKSTNSFRADDLPKAVLALTRAYEYLVLEEKDFKPETVEK